MRAPSIASTLTLVDDDRSSIVSNSTLRPSIRRGIVNKHFGHNKATERDEDDSVVAEDFEIGSKRIDPLISIEQMRCHLRLLLAFKMIKSACENHEGKRKANDKCWTRYLTRATHRFHVYINSILPNAPIKGASQLAKESAETILNLNQVSASPARQRAKFVPVDIPEKFLPPLDVAMVWHSYMLNPGRYMEDTARIPSYRVLLLVKFPLFSLASKISDATGRLKHSAETSSYWEGVTQMPLELEVSYTVPKMAPGAFHEVSLNDGYYIECPFCPHSSKTTGGTFVTWDDLSMPDWNHPLCDQCQSCIDKDVIRGHIFVRDVEKWLSDQRPRKEAMRMQGGYISARNGRFFESDPFAPILCRLFPFERDVRMDDEGMAAVLQCIVNNDEPVVKDKKGKLSRPLPNDLDTKDLLKRQVFPHDEGSIEGVAKLFEQSLRVRRAVDGEGVAIDRERRTSLLFSHYMEHDPLLPCSLDLVAAINRQSGFIDDMDSIGWLDDADPSDSPFSICPTKDQKQEMQGDVSTKDRESIAPEEYTDYGHLAKAHVRYHKWLHVLATTNELLCPTLDIDLGWHTHQLQNSYYADCFKAVGFFVDHNDKLSNAVLGGAFDTTGKLWYELFGQPYSVCGCAVHTGFSLKDIKRTVVSRLRGPNHKSTSTQSMSNDSKDEVVTAPASHPSTHNMVVTPSSTVEKLINDSRFHTEDKDTRNGKRVDGHQDAFV